MQNRTWEQMRAELETLGFLKDGEYRVVSVDEKGVDVERVATGSAVRVTRRMIEKTAERVAAGDFIPRRKISYTVAIETTVVAALGSAIEECVQNGKRGYRARVQRAGKGELIPAKQLDSESEKFKGKSTSFEVGREYSCRKDIHDIFGGQQQGGISTPKASPFVLLFSSDSGHQYGYRDEFKEDGTYWYTGEGPSGDMKMLRGNKAILSHEENDKTLALFEGGDDSTVRFIGYGKYLEHHTETRPDSDGNPRQAIVFELEVFTDADTGGHDPEEQSGDEKRLTPRVAKKLSLAELKALALKSSRNTTGKTARRTATYNRSLAVRTYVLKRAVGKCEGCGKDAPFVNKKKEPYLEAHHTHRSADGGPDDIAHVIALCPTCHRLVHHGHEGDTYNKTLKEKLEVIEP